MDKSDRDSAVMYIPPSRRPRTAVRWWTECWDVCERCRWRVAAITDDPGTARTMVATGRAGRVVVARPAHARRVALAIVVACDPPDRPGRRDSDRPRRLKPPPEDGGPPPEV